MLRYVIQTEVHKDILAFHTQITKNVLTVFLNSCKYCYLMQCSNKTSFQNIYFIVFEFHFF